MSKFMIAKEIIKNNIEKAPYGLFNSCNLVNDEMEILYYCGGLTIEICYQYGYFEVFGLDSNDYYWLKQYYNTLLEELDEENEEE